MSNAIYPTLPGQTWPRGKTIRTSTMVKRASGRRFALSQQLYPTYLYRIPYSFLRPVDLATLGGFFRARSGRLDDFLFQDRDDDSVTAQVIGVGNGTNAAFQLMRTAGGVIEPVYAVNGTPSVYVNGVLTTAYTLSANGLVTFTTPPPAGHVVTWTGLYYWRVAFTKDEQDFDEFMRQLYSAKVVEFESFHP